MCENKWQSKENVFFMCAKGSRRTTTITTTTITLLAFTKRDRGDSGRGRRAGQNQKPFGHSPLKRQLKISARQNRKRAQQIRNLLLFSPGTHLAVSLCLSFSHTLLQVAHTPRVTRCIVQALTKYTTIPGNSKSWFSAWELRRPFQSHGYKCESLAPLPPSLAPLSLVRHSPRWLSRQRSEHKFLHKTAPGI